MRITVMNLYEVEEVRRVSDGSCVCFENVLRLICGYVPQIRRNSVITCSDLKKMRHK